SRRVPPERRKRTEISCDKCKSRKQKCQRPVDHASCRYCQTHGFECVTTQTRKKRNYASVEGLGARLGLLESLVKGLVPEVDTSSINGMRALGSSLGIPLPPPETVETVETADGDESADQELAPASPEEMPVLRDQQGQTQYIGPASSYLFQIKIRALFAGGQPSGQGQFFLFGSNPTEKAWVGEVTGLGRELSSGRSPVTNTSESSSGMIEDVAERGETSPQSALGDIIDGVVPDPLIAAFFDHIHADFPVLHEASFREDYERCCLQPSLLTSEVDPTWICSLLCVLLLGRRTIQVDNMSSQQGQEAEDRWWRKVQALLPSVIFISSISAVQALLLVSLHLNNTNHRDSCWTLTGAAVRIAIAIGLHRDTKASTHTPLHRELRKRLWWTLYQFELMQAASLDRPSAIDDAACTVSTPREATLGMGSSESMVYSSRLLVMLSQACRVVRVMNNHAEVGEKSYSGPLSPAAALIRDLQRWKESLPRHLSLDAVSGQSPSSQRTVILLHVQYYHVVSVVTRNAMLALVAYANAIKRLSLNPTQNTISDLSDVCADGAQESVRLLLRLDSIGGFDPVTWWDFYFLYAAALVLVLNIMCEAKRSNDIPMYRSRYLSTAVSLLAACAELAAKVLRDPMVPGTNRRYAVVIDELNRMSRN
ncbi:fungal-specific transcription factor domain-containing protein, partial [Pseudomassariella vexata]